jgi:hypothetical protein
MPMRRETSSGAALGRPARPVIQGKDAKLLESFAEVIVAPLARR